MSMRRYASHRDSGIPWLGDAPTHWKPKRLRFVARLNPSKSEVSGLPRELQVSFLPMEAIGEDGTLDLHRTRSLAEVETGYTYFRDGDVTVAKITPCFENGKGAIMTGLLGGCGFGTTELIVVRPDASQTTSHYLHWLFNSTPFRAIGESWMYGAGGQKRVPDDFLRDFAIAFPPLPEQVAIAAFLDRETDKIDALVEEQRRLIELLKEKRQAVISHAVTKGLDPTAPMKDSGVEWLGEAPAHWEFSRLKFLASVQTGVAKGKDVTGRSVTTIPYLRVANVQDGHIDLSDLATLEIPIEDVERYLLRPGDVLMNEGGDFDKLGRGAIWDGRVDPCIHQNHVFAVRPFRISPAWLNLATGSDYAQFFFMGRSKQSTNLASISSTNIMELPVLIPPEREQKDVLAFVEKQAVIVDALISEAEAAITLLQERRAALISAAVTGKIDVGGIVPFEANKAA